LTDVDGVLDKNNKLISHINNQRADAILENVTGGMKTKLITALKSASEGIKQVIIASGLRENPILKALANENCTIITD
jgi:acetylglutamate kinase